MLNDMSLVHFISECSPACVADAGIDFSPFLTDSAPVCVALTRPRKFAPFPVKKFFRGDSRPFAATCGEPPRLAASCGLNPIQSNTIQSNTAHQLHKILHGHSSQKRNDEQGAFFCVRLRSFAFAICDSGTIFFPCACAVPFQDSSRKQPEQIPPVLAVSSGRPPWNKTFLPLDCFEKHDRNRKRKRPCFRLRERRSVFYYAVVCFTFVPYLCACAAC